jgi:hypothetical protein
VSGTGSPEARVLASGGVVAGRGAATPVGVLQRAARGSPTLDGAAMGDVA